MKNYKEISLISSSHFLISWPGGGTVALRHFFSIGRFFNSKIGLIDDPSIFSKM